MKKMRGFLKGIDTNVERDVRRRKPQPTKPNAVYKKSKGHKYAL